MSIQFVCPSCDHPIEIDDEWSSQSVACPFCHNTVSAPAVSTFVPPPNVPTASPVGGPVSPPSGANVAAIAGLALSCFWLVCYVGIATVFASNLLDVVGPDATPEELTRFIEEQMQLDPPPRWMMMGSLLFLLSCIFWLCGLICAVIGVRRVHRRGLAIAALAVLSLGPILACMGLAG